MGKKYTYLCLVIIVFLAFFLRMYLLGTVPPGLTNDEADIGYDAYSVLVTGKDQWNQFLPLTNFKGFGDYRLPLYTYLVIPSEQVFGVTAFAVRFPSAIFGTLSVMLVFFLARKLFESIKEKDVLSLCASCLIAISPWAIGLSRIGIESNVAISLFLLAFMLFLYSFKYKRLIFLSCFFFALTLYTYTAYTFFTPLALVTIVFFFRKKFKYKKNLTLAFLLFVLFVSPLFLFRSTAGVRAAQVSFVTSQDNIGVLANLNDRRGSCSEKFPTLVCKVVENKELVIANTFIKNYLNHFSFSFLFLDGSVTQYSILPQRSLFYTIELLFLLSGLIGIITQKNKMGYVVLVLLMISVIPDAITGEGHYSRASGMMPFIFILEGFGLLYLYNFISSFKKFISLILKSSLFLLISFSIVSFFISYFSYFPKYYSGYSQYGYQQWAHTIVENKEQYNKIFLSKYGNDTKQYIYFLFYTKYDPSSFQKKKDISYSSGQDGWVSIDRINNLYFMQNLPAKIEIPKYRNQKILLVSHPKEFPLGFKIKDQVKDLNGNGVFAFVPISDLQKYFEAHPTVTFGQ